MEKNNSYAPGFRPHCISVTGYLFFLLNFFLLQVLDDRDVLLIQTVYSPCDAPRNVSLDNHCYLTNYNVFRINLLRFKLHGDILICCIRTTTRVMFQVEMVRLFIISDYKLTLVWMTSRVKHTCTFSVNNTTIVAFRIRALLAKLTFSH